VHARGVPLSLVVTGAHRHDVTQLQAVLDGIVVKRDDPPKRRNKHLCADAAYTGAKALKIIETSGYIPHVKGRGKEAKELKKRAIKDSAALGSGGGAQLVQSLSQIVGGATKN
jgi:hypothetical protein